MNKSDIRIRMKSFLAGMSPEDRHARSLAACHHLCSTREFKNAHMIMIFLALPSEIETSTIAITAWSEGKQIAVPRLRPDDFHMDPVQIDSLDFENTPPAGIPSLRQPDAGCVVPLSMIDMVIVPGLAFDHNGCRLGRGKGYYDRFLSRQNLRATRCALSFHEQLRHDPLPIEDHDMPMDLIVTDKQIVHCKKDHHSHA